MFYLILTFCTTAAMDNCTTYQVEKFSTEQQCDVMTDIYTQTLGEGPNQNYRLECIYDPV